MTEINYQLIRFQADNIPKFDGNPKQINRFINACENFLENHQDTNNPNSEINICLLDTILSKLINRAADLISSRIELNNWNSIKNAIINTFSDQRSIDCVLQDILTLRPNKNELSQQFGIRLQDMRSLLFSKINMSDDPREIKILKIREYDNLVLKTFINGLNYNTQLIVRLKNPINIEEAMSYALEEENFLYYKNRQPHYTANVSRNNSNNFNRNNNNNFSRHNNNFSRNNNLNNNFQNRQMHNSNFNRNNFNRFSNQNFNNFNHNNNNTNRNNFTGFGQFRSNSGNVYNVNNRQNSANRRFTNFNNNNFNNNNFNRNNRVEPMDISSGNTILNDYQNNRYSRNNPNGNPLIFEEINNHTVQSKNDENSVNFPEASTSKHPT